MVTLCLSLKATCVKQEAVAYDWLVGGGVVKAVYVESGTRRSRLFIFLPSDGIDVEEHRVELNTD